MGCNDIVELARMFDATWSMLLNVQCKFQISTCAKEMQKVVKAQMLAMPKHVIKFVFKVVRNGALWFYTCPNV